MKNPIKTLWNWYKSRKASKEFISYTGRLAGVWAHIAQTKTPERVETLEGFRALANSSAMDLGYIALSGIFEVESPIKINTTCTVYDFSDCLLVPKVTPLFIVTGPANCFYKSTLDVSNVSFTEVAATYPKDEEPPTNALFTGPVDCGTGVIGLKIFTTENPCPSEEVVEG